MFSSTEKLFLGLAMAFVIAVVGFFVWNQIFIPADRLSATGATIRIMGEVIEAYNNPDVLSDIIVVETKNSPPGRVTIVIPADQTSCKVDYRGYIDSRKIQPGDGIDLIGSVTDDDEVAVCRSDEHYIKISRPEIAKAESKPTDSTWRVYQNEHPRFEFQYPSNWYVGVVESGLLISNAPIEEEEGSRLSILISDLKQEDLMGLGDQCEATLFAGVDAYKCTSVKGSVLHQLFIFTRQSQVFEISYAVQDDISASIISTFRFLE